jgi:hypothetical protein
LGRSRDDERGGSSGPRNHLRLALINLNNCSVSKYMIRHACGDWPWANVNVSLQMKSATPRGKTAFARAALQAADASFLNLIHSASTDDNEASSFRLGGVRLL